MKNKLLLAVGSIALLTACDASKENEMEWFDHAVKTSGHQLLYMSEQLKNEPDTACFPRSIKEGKYRLEHPTDWTSGFYPGSMWLAYELTGDEVLAKEARKYTDRLQDMQYYTGNHDLGCMMFCSYGQGIRLKPEPRQVLETGDVGYIISGIKTSSEVKVGDTITHVDEPCDVAIDGFEEVKPMVFAGIYPIDSEDYEDLSPSIEKLQFKDESLTFEPESSAALGFGFRCGFLGMLHMEIVQERLDREFDMNVITTVPNVMYIAHTTKGEVYEMHNPSDMPSASTLDFIEEPFIRAQIITPADYIGPIMTLCLGKRGILINQQYHTGNRIEITYEMPLGEIVFDFYDKLKSITKGYASFDYYQIGYRRANLVKLDILLNGESVDALSALIHFDNAYGFGRRICEKLKELIPRQQFDIAVQAAIGAKVIARETIKAVRKDVTAKCYGGDISRKRKLLEKQKKGKKRMKQIGNVEVPQKAFLAVLKLD